MATESRYPQAQPEEATEGAEIETRDGKEKMSIWLAAGNSINFGKTAWVIKGETITFSIECEQERKLEIGIMAISTEKVYSKIVKTGTGTIAITVPEDGEYRVYLKNHASDRADFQLKLNKKLEGPLV
jgi:hypothetical protein